MNADDVARTLYDEMRYFLRGYRHILHVIACPDDEAMLRRALAADPFVMPVHLRASILVEPGKAITMSGELGALGCRDCDPAAGAPWPEPEPIVRTTPWLGILGVTAADVADVPYLAETRDRAVEPPP